MPTHATILAPPPESLTLREKILLAALTIEAETFKTGRLVVRAWETYPLPVRFSISLRRTFVRFGGIYSPSPAW